MCARLDRLDPCATLFYLTLRQPLTTVSWTGTPCQRLGAQPQAAELDQLDSGDHYSSGNSENIYHPRGVCEGVHCTSSFPGLYHWADGLTADGEDGRVPGRSSHHMHS